MNQLKKNRSARRRRLFAESLESRAMLATLGLGVEFLEADGTTPAAALQVGREYFANVKVDVVDSDVGVISLPLSYSWDPKVLQLVEPVLAESTPLVNAQVPDSLVPAAFPLQRRVENFSASAEKFAPGAETNFDNFVPFYNLQEVRGGALPAAGSGQAISVGTNADTFSRLKFRVVSDPNAFAATTFTIVLDGSMSFENGEQLDLVTGVLGAENLNLPTAATNQIVQATIPVSIGGTKQEVNADNATGPPASPLTFVLDFGNDGIFDGPNDQTVSTAADGSYQFVIPTDTPAGSYSIQERLPDGRIRLAPASGAFLFTVNDAGEITSTDNPDSPLPPLDFVNQVVVLSGTKFDDRFDSGTTGVRDTTDPPMAGVTIALDIGNDGPTTPDLTVVTAADGSYRFTEVPIGTHRVYEPNDDNQTFPSSGSYLVTVDETSVTVDPDVARDALDFGNQVIPPMFGTISGTKWIDSNQNSAIDPGIDTPHAGVTFRLDIGNDGLTANDSIANATSNAAGQYVFANVPEGIHSVHEIVPPGFTQVLPASSHVVTVNSDGSVTSPSGFDFLNAAVPVQSSISGYVYTDNDLDGQFDSDEIGLPGVTVRLISSTPGVPTQTTVTGPDGWYNFENVPVGTYSIEEIQPPRFGDASISLGQVLPGTAAIGTTTGMNRFDGVVVGSGQSATNFNFGENLQVVTKRMLLARSSVREEIFTNAGVVATTVNGTAGDDVVRIEQTNTNWRVTVNGQTTLVPRDQMLIVDTQTGNDQVDVIGTSNAEEAHVRQNQLALVTDPTSGNGLLVLGVEQITVDGRLGDDLFVLEGSSSVDQFSGSGDQATLTYGVGSTIARGLSFDRVRAVNPSGSPTNQSTAAATDYVLQLIGDWNA